MKSSLFKLIVMSVFVVLIFLGAAMPLLAEFSLFQSLVLIPAAMILLMTLLAILDMKWVALIGKLKIAYLKLIKALGNVPSLQSKLWCGANNLFVRAKWTFSSFRHQHCPMCKA